MIGGPEREREASSDLGVLCVLRDLVSQKSREKRSTKNITAFPPRGHVQLFPRILFHTTTVCRVCHVTKEQTTTEKSSILIAEQVSTLPMFLKPNFISSVSTSPVDRNPIRTWLSIRELRHERGKNAGCSAAPLLPPEHAAPTSHRTLGRRELAEHYAHVHRATARRTSSFDTPPPSRDMASRDVLAPRDANLDPFSARRAAPRAPLPARGPAPR